MCPRSEFFPASLSLSNPQWWLVFPERSIRLFERIEKIFLGVLLASVTFQSLSSKPLLIQIFSKVFARLQSLSCHSQPGGKNQQTKPTKINNDLSGVEKSFNGEKTHRSCPSPLQARQDLSSLRGPPYFPLWHTTERNSCKTILFYQKKNVFVLQKNVS